MTANRRWGFGPHRLSSRMSASLLALLFACVLAGTSPAAQAETAGSTGLSFQVETEGFFANPVLKRVWVQRVGTGLPPAAQAVAVGDELLELEGRTVVGARAWAMKSLMDVPPGTPLRLRLKRPDGEVYSTTLVARERRVVVDEEARRP